MAHSVAAASSGASFNVTHASLARRTSARPHAGPSSPPPPPSAPPLPPPRPPPPPQATLPTGARPLTRSTTTTPHSLRLSARRSGEGGGGARVPRLQRCCPPALLPAAAPLARQQHPSPPCPALPALPAPPRSEVFTPLVEKCKRLNRAMRIGTNHGSLSARILSYYGGQGQGQGGRGRGGSSRAAAAAGCRQPRIGCCCLGAPCVHAACRKQARD